MSKRVTVTTVVRQRLKPEQAVLHRFTTDSFTNNLQMGPIYSAPITRQADCWWAEIWLEFKSLYCLSRCICSVFRIPAECTIGRLAFQSTLHKKTRSSNHSTVSMTRRTVSGPENMADMSLFVGTPATRTVAPVRLMPTSRLIPPSRKSSALTRC